MIYRKSHPAELQYKVLVDTLAQMKSLGLQRVRLSGGGEPTFHRSFQKIIEHLYKHDIVLSNLTTNGLLCDNTMLDLLCSGKWFGIVFSLQVLNEKDWMKITGGPRRGFQKVMKNIRYLVEKKLAAKSSWPYVCLSLGINEFTYRNLTGGYEFAQELGVDVLSFKTYNTYKYSKKVLSASNYILKQLKDIKDDNEMNKRSMSIAYSLKDLKLNEMFSQEYDVQGDESAFYCSDHYNTQCFMPWFGTLIRASGDVSVCCALPPESPVLGNIYDASFKTIWFGKKYTEIRNKFERVLNSKTINTKYLPINIRCTKYARPDEGCSLRVSLERMSKYYM